MLLQLPLIESPVFVVLGMFFFSAARRAIGAVTVHHVLGVCGAGLLAVGVARSFEECDVWTTSGPRFHKSARETVDYTLHKGATGVGGLWTLTGAEQGKFSLVYRKATDLDITYPDYLRGCGNMDVQGKYAELTEFTPGPAALRGGVDDLDIAKKMATHMFEVVQKRGIDYIEGSIAYGRQSLYTVGGFRPHTTRPGWVSATVPKKVSLHHRHDSEL